jgi:disulfide bond formation protein DsbB
MAAALTTARPAAFWWRRVAVVLALFSSGLHIASLGDHRVSPLMVLLTVGMLLGCLHCARHLWMRDNSRDWGWVAIMSVGMITLHTVDFGPSVSGHHGHTTRVANPTAVGHALSLPMAAALLTAALEAVIALSMVFYRTRNTDPLAPNLD